MKRSLLLFTAAAALIFQAACSTGPTVNQDSVPDFNPADYSTFALLRRDAGAGGAGRPVSPSLVRSVRDTATQILTRKGLEETDLADADLAFQISGGTMPKVDVHNYGFAYSRHAWRYGYGYGVTPAYSASTYTEGTLVLNAFDTQTKELVWQGYSTRRTNTSFSDETVLETLRAVLEAFPQKPLLSSGP